MKLIFYKNVKMIKCACCNEIIWLITVKMKMIKKSISIDLDIDLDTNVQNMACLSKIMSISNKQHLRNI